MQTADNRGTVGMGMEYSKLAAVSSPLPLHAASLAAPEQERDITPPARPAASDSLPFVDPQPRADYVPQSRPGYLAVKRGLDVCGAFAGLFLLAPVLLVIAFLVRVGSHGPVFHRRRVLLKQTYHIGVPPRTFDAFKFRTMLPNADAILQSRPDLMREYIKDFKLREDPRVTPLGNSLRRTSLDELPQLINILCGQMSLVGPRMITPPELSMYGENAAKLLSVKPGLTGLWQVSGRQNITYSERVRLDMWYIENRTIWLDLQILYKTVGSVLARRGAF